MIDRKVKVPSSRSCGDSVVNLYQFYISIVVLLNIIVAKATGHTHLFDYKTEWFGFFLSFGPTLQRGDVIGEAVEAKLGWSCGRRQGCLAYKNLYDRSSFKNKRIIQAGLLIITPPKERCQGWVSALEWFFFPYFRMKWIIIFAII